MQRASLSAFTLIELLVVITIIVVLLTLLAPALDKAIYQAELAVCGANLKAVGTGVTAYAADSRRQYPARPSLQSKSPPMRIASAGRDDRPYLRNYLSINKNLVDPFCKSLDFEGASAGVASMDIPYALWYRWSWPDGKGMTRLGDRLEFVRDSGGNSAPETFAVLASDVDFIFPGGNIVFGAHPDADGLLQARSGIAEGRSLPDLGTYTYTRWESRGVNFRRGLTDQNAVFTDGSVERYNYVPWYEGKPAEGGQERLVAVPWFNDITDYTTQWVHIPVR